MNDILYFLSNCKFNGMWLLTLCMHYFDKIWEAKLIINQTFEKLSIQHSMFLLLSFWERLEDKVSWLELKFNNTICTEYEATIHICTFA